MAELDCCHLQEYNVNPPEQRDQLLVQGRPTKPTMGSGYFRFVSGHLIIEKFLKASEKKEKNVQVDYSPPCCWSFESIETNSEEE